MDDDLTRLEQVLRDRAAEVPYQQEAPAKLLARARRRMARNALSSFVVVGVLVVGASTGLAGLGALRGPDQVTPGSSSGTHSPAPAGSDCTAEDLRATSALDGAAGSVVGSVQLTNLSTRTCTLNGRPTVSPFDPQDRGLAVDVVEVQPQWQVDGTPMPESWPVVRLDPGDVGSIRIRWGNACPQLSGPARLSMDLGDGKGALDVSASAPPCLGSGEPSTLEVGPFEPIR
jgi:hypothetical protein